MLTIDFRMSLPPATSDPGGRKISGTEGPDADEPEEKIVNAAAHTALINELVFSQSSRLHREQANSQMALLLAKRTTADFEGEIDTTAKRQCPLPPSGQLLPTVGDGQDNGALPSTASAQATAFNFQSARLIRSLSTSAGTNGPQDVQALNATEGLLMNRDSLRAQILQEQAARNAANAALLASFSQPATASSHHQQLMPALSQLQQAPGSCGGHSLLSLSESSTTISSEPQIASLRSRIAELEAMQRGSTGYVSSSGPRINAAQRLQFPQTASKTGNVSQLLQQRGNPQVSQASTHTTMGTPFISQQASAITFPHASGIPGFGYEQTMNMPICEEGQLAPHYDRPMFSLSIDEDPNWLSEFHCFVRSELVEVFRASHEDVKARNNSISFLQVGLRCRFCAHLVPNSRAGRSCAFPSSLRQIYQSFTMMLRDHFGNCSAIPASTSQKFLSLKDRPAQGATDSKRYWMYSAMKIGMADSTGGIVMNESTRSAGQSAPPFGSTPIGEPWPDDAYRQVSLVLPSDRGLVTEFLFVLLSQVQVIHLTESERIGNRRSLRAGLPGFGCRYCCEKRRLGLCRIFPARRRTLPAKVSDIYDHLYRCSLCPTSIKEHLERTKHQLNTGYHADQGGDRDFFDRIWSRLGHQTP